MVNMFGKAADKWLDRVIDIDPPGWRDDRRRRHEDDYDDGEEYEEEHFEYDRRRHYGH
jgi:hypothetical protein